MSTEIQIVTFNLGKEKFGLDIMKIDTVAEYEEVTVIPHVADYLEGVINFRKQQVLPIVNMRSKFNLPPFEDKTKCKVIVLKIGEKRIGIMVDDVKEVKSITSSLIEEKPDIGGRIIYNTDYQKIKYLLEIEEKSNPIENLEKYLFNYLKNLYNINSKELNPVYNDFRFNNSYFAGKGIYDTDKILKGEF